MSNPEQGHNGKKKLTLGQAVVTHIVWWGGIALILLLVYGALTGKLWGDSGVECYPYEDPSGEIVTTCDDGFPGSP